MQGYPPQRPRNGLGTATLVVVLLGALLAVIPATAGLGLLLCLVAIVPAVVAWLRTRRGVASNRRSSVAAVAMAPAFVVVAVVVGAAATPSATGPVGRAADGSSVAARGIPAAPALAPAGQLGDGAVAPPPAVRRVAPPTSIGSVAPRGPAKPQVARITGRAAAAPTAAPRTQATPPALKPAPAKPAAPSGGGCDEGTHYVNVSGNCVLRPVEAAVAPAGASARCKDGTYSSSQHRSGTCSGHKGVAEWLKDLP